MATDDNRAPALADLTPFDLRAGNFDAAVLPIGATEYHGDHLPYSTDTIAAEALAHRLALEIGTAVVLPSLDYGMSLHMLAWPWSLSLRPETLTNVVIDIAESLLEHDIDRLLVVSAHDGNPPCIENAARELSDTHDMTVAIFAGWQELARRLLAGDWDVDEDHGGESEMSIVLYAAPHLAHPERATNLPRQQGDHPVKVRGPFSNAVPHGYSGSPGKGSAEQGEAIVSAIAAHVGPFLRDLADHGWTNEPWMSGIDPPDPDQDPRHVHRR
jgi:creatinine amidohydrolase